MKMFMIRWQNGETSFVGAPTKDEALLFADNEWDDPFGAEITEINRFAMDIKPSVGKSVDDEVIYFDAKLTGFGGSDKFEPIRRAYPIAIAKYEDNICSAGDTATVGEAYETVQAALEADIKREIEPAINKASENYPVLEIYKRMGLMADKQAVQTK